MLQELSHTNHCDVGGNPAGGLAKARGIEIVWQDGPLRGGEPTGAFVETVIQAALERLRFYQKAGEGRFKCRENDLAITHLEEAQHWLFARTADREKRGVEGTHKV